MTHNVPPSSAGRRNAFTALVDWVEVNMDTDDRPPSDDADTLESASWIREFIQAGRDMPLHTPPEPVRDELRLAFRRRLRPHTPDEFLEIALSFDSREHDIASGMRSGGTSAEPRHLVLENEHIHLALTVVSAETTLADTASTTVDLEGHVTWQQPGTGTTELVFTAAGGATEQTVLADEQGHFLVKQLVRETDEIRIARDPWFMRACVDLQDRG